MAVSGNNNNKEKEIKTKEKEAKRKNSKVKAFFRGVWSELKKVHWPTKKQLVHLHWCSYRGCFGHGDSYFCL